MPAKGKSRLSDRQKQRIAAGKALGRRHRDIAADTRLAKTTVDHAVLKPETKALIQQFKDENQEQLSRMYKKALGTLDADLDRKAFDARIRSRAQLMGIIQAGDERIAIGDLGAGEDGGKYSLEELLVEHVKLVRRK